MNTPTFTLVVDPSIQTQNTKLDLEKYAGLAAHLYRAIRPQNIEEAKKEFPKFGLSMQDHRDKLITAFGAARTVETNISLLPSENGGCIKVTITFFSFGNTDEFMHIDTTWNANTGEMASSCCYCREGATQIG